MKKLLVYLKGYEKETVLAPLFKMLEALFELFVPLVMAAVIDVGIGGHDRGYVIRMCLVLIALGVIGLACSITAQYFARKQLPDSLLCSEGSCLHIFRVCLTQRWTIWVRLR